VAASGYTRIELGPYGYRPTDPVRLREELDKRCLTMTAGTIFEHLHRQDSKSSAHDPPCHQGWVVRLRRRPAP
jgi:inosose dehydratase